MMNVKAWVERVTIPTYAAGKPEKNPMFLEKRVYQGSSGVVYPHPVIESISDKKEDKEYMAVFLENEYLKIMILPELGGRIQRAFDKVKNRDFVYYNQVVKPALVGLAGPWISGGIEFNWPQHHRPSTFSPVDYTIQESNDGSKTVWVNELEVMFRTKGMAGFTLYQDKAYLEIKGRLYNASSFPQTFLWWANPAVKVNEHYQSVFPPDVYAVFDHGKRDVSDFPIATGTYYKVNYAPGTDISRYVNIPVPTSYMAIQSQYDFIGCYEHDTKAGMLHVADHHISPGKKQWTWGNGDFGFAWDKQLTDEDGPYIELMTGVYTDNQPDFSWLHPNETKTFEQYFMPYSEAGAIKNATKEAMLNVEWEEDRMHVHVYATSVYNNAIVNIFFQDTLCQQFRSLISPANVFHEVYQAERIGNELDWKVSVLDDSGNELVCYQPTPASATEMPAPATAAKRPAEIEQVEDLYLNGLHLEQYRHATYQPLDYYEEGIRRSPGDIRCNNAKGLYLLRRGQFKQSEPYFRKAIETLTKRNPNPYDGEPFYNLGLCLVFQGRHQEAYDAFFKATWNDAWQHSSFLWLSRIALHASKVQLALELIEKSLVRNYHSPSARHIKSIALRMLNRIEDSSAWSKESLLIDPFNVGCLYEQFLASQATDDQQQEQFKDQFAELMRHSENNYLELALSYAHAGLFAEGIELLSFYETLVKGQSTPLVSYYLGWLNQKAGKEVEAKSWFQKAAAKDPGTCFPNKVEEILILESAQDINPEDGKAYYYLGNLWYDKRQYTEAIACWEKAALLDSKFPTPFRNLSIAYYNKLGQKEKAIQFMEKAFSLDQKDARILMELDQLYKVTGRPFQERLNLLEKYPALIQQRDDLYLERITLCNNLHLFGKAKELLTKRNFHPWEGGEGKVTGQYLLCLTEMAKICILEERYEEGLQLLKEAVVFPDNLGEGKLYGAQENDLNYLMGCAYEGLQQTQKAIEYFNKATIGISEPMQAIYYNDPQPDKIFYQALSWLKLEYADKAKNIFEKFIRFGEAHMQDDISIDYFAVSLPDMLVFDIDLNLRNRIHCTYLKGLGKIGLGDYHDGEQLLNSVLEMDVNHQGAATYLRMIPFIRKTNRMFYEI